jgi:hypothetical protein
MGPVRAFMPLLGLRRACRGKNLTHFSKCPRQLFQHFGVDAPQISPIEAKKIAESAAAQLARDHGPRLAELQWIIDCHQSLANQGYRDNQSVIDAATQERQRLVDAYSPPCMPVQTTASSSALPTLPSIPTMVNYPDRGSLLDEDQARGVERAPHNESTIWIAAAYCSAEKCTHTPSKLARSRPTSFRSARNPLARG